MPATPPSFAADILPLFRQSDIDAMLDWFHLGKYEDVKDNADIILERLEDGTMPCDAEWSPDQLALFRAWRDGGFAA